MKIYCGSMYKDSGLFSIYCADCTEKDGKYWINRPENDFRFEFAESVSKSQIDKLFNPYDSYEDFLVIYSFDKDKLYDYLNAHRIRLIAETKQKLENLEKPINIIGE